MLQFIKSLLNHSLERIKNWLSHRTTLEVSPQILQETLSKFKGHPIPLSKITSFHQFTFPIYTNPSIVPDPRIQSTSHLDITAVYANYQKHYAVQEGASFTAFIKWLAIKSMQNTPFNWRYINQNWYEFDNLPLEVVARTNENRQVSLNTLYDVNNMSWQAFCDAHLKLKKGEFKDNFVKGGLPVHWLAYQIVGLHIPHMTSYNTTTRATYTHQPWIVFSDRFAQGECLLQPLYISYSHATLTPEDHELFIKRFLSYGSKTPQEVESDTMTLTTTAAIANNNALLPLKTAKKSHDYSLRSQSGASSSQANKRRSLPPCH